MTVTGNGARAFSDIERDLVGDALAQLLDDVHRIADGLGGIRELAIAATTPRDAAEQRATRPRWDLAVEELQGLCASGERAGSNHAYVPIATLRAVLVELLISKGA